MNFRSSLQRRRQKRQFGGKRGRAYHAWSVRVAIGKYIMQTASTVSEMNITAAISAIQDSVRGHHHTGPEALQKA